MISLRSYPPQFQLTNSTTIAGDQLQDKSREWLSPEDPSTNYNIARKSHHDGTATWFIQGTTFREWEMTGSLIWIHGIRMFIPTLRLFPSMVLNVLHSRFGKEHPLVRIQLALLVSIHPHTN